MARGKKTSPEDIYKIMTSYAITNNYNQTAKDLGMAYATVKDIVERNKDKPEFVKLQDEKKATFVDKADVVIDLAIERMVERLSDDEEKIPLNHLAIVFGTAYDKRALAKGEMTQNLGFATNLSIDKLAEISGYGKKGADSE